MISEKGVKTVSKSGLTLDVAKEGDARAIQLDEATQKALAVRNYSLGQACRPSDLDTFCVSTNLPKSAFSSSLLVVFSAPSVLRFFSIKDAELGQVLALIKRGTITTKQAPQVYKQKKSPFRRTPRDVGTGWWIEAASLILGKARALMSHFIAKGVNGNHRFCTTS